MLPAPALPGIAVKLPVSIEPLQSGPAGRALAPAASRAARQTRRAAAASLGIGSREPTAAARGRGRRDSADAGATPSARGAAGRVCRCRDRARHRDRLPRPARAPGGNDPARLPPSGRRRSGPTRSPSSAPSAPRGPRPAAERAPARALGRAPRHPRLRARPDAPARARARPPLRALRAALLRGGRPAAGGGACVGRERLRRAPSELEANAASAAYAARTLSAAELDELRACEECAGCSTPEAPPADVVERDARRARGAQRLGAGARAGAAPRLPRRGPRGLRGLGSRPTAQPAARRRASRSRWPERRRRALLYSACVLEQGIYLGDNLELLPSLPDSAFTLVYLDPPFNTGQDPAPSDALDRRRPGRRPDGLRRSALPLAGGRERELPRQLRRLPRLPRAATPRGPPPARGRRDALPPSRPA